VLHLRVTLYNSSIVKSSEIICWNSINISIYVPVLKKISVDEKRDGPTVAKGRIRTDSYGKSSLQYRADQSTSESDP